MPEMLFVYGTLRPDAECAMGREARPRLRSESQLLGSARTQGTLYDLGRYPGLGLGSGWVVGSVYQLNTIAKTLDWLDKYEGITGAPTDEYYRRRCAVISEGDHQILAWAYILRRVPPSATLMRSGNWLER